MGPARQDVDRDGQRAPALHGGPGVRRQLEARIAQGRQPILRPDRICVVDPHAAGVPHVGKAAAVIVVNLEQEAFAAAGPHAPLGEL